MAKEHAGRELWDRLQQFAATDDGPPVYDCGPWTIQKLFFLCQYLATTTKTIVGHRAFSSVNYIDLFASNGICSVRGGDGRSRRYAGSALLAGGCKKPFDNMFLVEENGANLNKLKSRLDRLACKSTLHLHAGDSNAHVPELVKILPARALNVAFIDPFSLGIHFDSVELLARKGAVDLIILFADAMDISRNVGEYYESGRSNKLDLFLGHKSKWRDKWNLQIDRTGSACRDFFAGVYLEQLKSLGYKHSRKKAISSDHGQLYSLIYASKNPLGLKFWDIAANEDLDGTKNLWS